MDSTNDLDTQKLGQVLKLLEESFRNANTEQLKKINAKLNELAKDTYSHILLMIQALALENFNNQKITNDLHQSTAIYLKNLVKKIDMESEKLINIMIKVINIGFLPYLNKGKYEYIKLPVITHALESIINSIFDNTKISQNKMIIQKIFDHIMSFKQNVDNESFIGIYLITIRFFSVMFSSHSVSSENYLYLLDNYFIKVTDEIFANVKNYIKINNNNPEDINFSFIVLLRELFDRLYLVLTKMKQYLTTKEKINTSMKIFNSYGKYAFELLQVNIPLSNESLERFKKNNPLICLDFLALSEESGDKDKKFEINLLKSRALQLLSFLSQYSTLVEDRDRPPSFVELGQDIINVIWGTLQLIVNSLEDMLSSEEKLKLLQENSINQDEDNPLSNLLFQFNVFLARVLVREPIKSRFAPLLNKFIMNITFPCIFSSDVDKKFIVDDPGSYHTILNDMIDRANLKPFRTSCCFLLRKMCDEICDLKQFVVSYIVQWLEVILNQNENAAQNSAYNVYLQNRDLNSLIEKLPDEFKLDFIFLIILVLRADIKQNKQRFHQLTNSLFQNQKKLNSVNSELIEMKMCMIYKEFLVDFVSVLDGKGEKDEKIKEFVNESVIFLLNCLVKDSNNLKDGDEGIIYESSEALKSLTENDRNKFNDLFEISLVEKIPEMNKLIGVVDVEPFFELIDNILEKIPITNRDDLLFCIQKLTSKFIAKFSQGNEETKWYINRYFNLMNSFMTGENHIPVDNKEEIKKLDDILEPILNYIKKPGKPVEFYESIISLQSDYISMTESINYQSFNVLKILPTAIKTEKNINEIHFHFLSKFINHLPNCSLPINLPEILNDVINIIVLGFDYEDDYYNISINNSLLLTLQLFSLNINLDRNVLSLLLKKAFENVIEDSQDSDEDFDDKIFHDDEGKDKQNLLALAVISTGLVYRPLDVFSILSEDKNFEREEDRIKNANKFDKFINFTYMLYSTIKDENYIALLGKIVLLGICSMLKNQDIVQYLKNSKVKDFLCTSSFEHIKKFQNKSYFYLILKCFYRFFIRHKHIIIENRKTKLKKEIECHFVEEKDDDNFSDSDDDINEDDIDEIEENLELVLEKDTQIKNSDEFKFFSEVIKHLNESEKDIWDNFYKELPLPDQKSINHMMFVRNIKIVFNDSEYFTPRRTVKIKRKQ